MTKILAFALLLVPALSHANAVPDYSNVLSAVTVDFNEDGQFDRAVLVSDGADQSSLFLYISGKQALVKSDAAWSGFMWGTLASLEVSKSGRLLVKSGNDSIGRGRWSQTLEVNYVKGEFLVASVMFTYNDTLDANASGNCFADYETGDAHRNAKPVSFAKATVKLSDWKATSLPSFCKF